jgi:hypothetical protein
VTQDRFRAYDFKAVRQVPYKYYYAWIYTPRFALEEALQHYSVCLVLLRRAVPMTILNRRNAALAPRGFAVIFASRREIDICALVLLVSIFGVIIQNR